MKTGRVLVADAHLNMLEGVHSLLESVFETVVMVADERSLISALETVEPDLVIADLSLPVAAAPNIALKLRDRFPAVRVVVLSVHDEPVIARQLRERGVAGIVLKRTAVTDLLPAIREVLSGGEYVSRDLQGDRPDANCP